MSDSDGDPPILYHYTSAAGLLGIIKGSPWELTPPWPEVETMLDQAGHLYASDVRYMSDSQELKYGAEQFVPRLQAAGNDQLLSENKRYLCQRLASIFSSDDVFDYPMRCFAACFCERGDLLSQWRGYAEGVGGFAIGFDRDALQNRSYALAYEKNMQVDRPEKADLQPIRYGDANAGALADKFIDDEICNPTHHMSLVIDAKPEWPHMRGIALESLATLFLRAIAGVKNDGFKEEREWRLYYVGDPTHPVKIRAGRQGIVPFLHMAVNMKTSDEETIPSAISKLVVGPGHNQKSQMRAARELLRACGHDPDVVVASKLSFTG
jgi:Protein of unknown function (DUF2971)